jgi:predicted helicase
LLMAPYACAHFKLGLELAARDMDELWREHWSYEFQPGERLNIFLTNTLDDLNEKMQRTLGLAEQEIAKEAQSAAEVKTKKPVLVVLGNPPYSGHSANKGEWIVQLVRDYYQVDGQPLGERNPKWLQDDYVKFIRWAQWRIEQTGQGILAFVTNHGYLDNPTFRGMRQQLMAAFDEIWLVDLHGNSKKKEVSPDGGRDQNVFDIQQGVALGLFVKRPVKPGVAKKPATVRHGHLWGTRARKYAWLDQHDVDNTKWATLKPKSPDYFFFPQNLELKAEYEKGWKVTEMMPVNVLGFQTHRDQFAIAFEQKSLTERAQELRNSSINEQVVRDKFGLTDNRDWSLNRARDTLRKSKDWEKQIIPVSYRPFDERWCFFREEFTDYPRRELRQHVFNQQNLCLNLVRQTRSQKWRHVFVSDTPTPAVFLEIKDGSSIFPLYLYPQSKEPDELVVEEEAGRRPNLSTKFVAHFGEKLKLKFLSEGVRDRGRHFGPEEILHFAYAILNAPSYQARYREFLCTDFPRLPLTSDAKLYRQMLGFGKDLVDLHLLQQSGPFHVSFPSKGKNLVDEVSYEPPKGKSPGRVRINEEQWFENVPLEVWEYHVGGYQVCEKWLKDRKGRQLTIEERQIYPKIVAALHETIRIQREIDEAIAAAGGWPLK